MRYQRQALMDACDTALKLDHEAWCKRKSEALAEESQRLHLWYETYGEAWAAAGLTIRRAIREGRPVTREMIPWSEQYGRPTVYQPNLNVGKEYIPPRELVFLRRILDLVGDEVVTTHGLKDLGVTVTTMRTAAWHMAVGSAKEGR